MDSKAELLLLEDGHGHRLVVPREHLQLQHDGYLFLENKEKHAFIRSEPSGRSRWRGLAPDRMTVDTDKHKRHAFFPSDASQESAVSMLLAFYFKRIRRMSTRCECHPRPRFLNYQCMNRTMDLKRYCSVRRSMKKLKLAVSEEVQKNLSIVKLHTT